MCRILSILSSTLAVGGLSSLVCPPLLSHLIMSSLLWVPCRPSSWIQCMQPPVGWVSHSIIISRPQSRAPFNSLLWLPTWCVVPTCVSCVVWTFAQTHFCSHTAMLCMQAHPSFCTYHAFNAEGDSWTLQYSACGSTAVVLDVPGNAVSI